MHTKEFSRSVATAGPRKESTSRREFLRMAGMGGTALLGLSMPGRLKAFTPPQHGQTTITSDMIAQMRASGAKAVLKSENLRDQVYVITGSGGNVAVLDGPDGKVMVDTGFATSEKQFRTELGSIGSEPLKLLINTHWHFDHTDGNEWLHKAGATILAHENTRLRLSIPQEIAAFHVHFDPSPAAALPQQTFVEETKLTSMARVSLCTTMNRRIPTLTFLFTFNMPTCFMRGIRISRDTIR